MVVDIGLSKHCRRRARDDCFMLVDPFIIPFIPCFHVLFRKVTADTGFPQASMVAGGGWFQRGPGEQRDVAAGQSPIIIRDDTSHKVVPPQVINGL